MNVTQKGLIATPQQNAVLKLKSESCIDHPRAFTKHYLSLRTNKGVKLLHLKLEMYPLYVSYIQHIYLWHMCI